MSKRVMLVRRAVRDFKDRNDINAHGSWWRVRKCVREQGKGWRYHVVSRDNKTRRILPADAIVETAVATKGWFTKVNRNVWPAQGEQYHG